jgi:hypothetical protein
MFQENYERKLGSEPRIITIHLDDFEFEFGSTKPPHILAIFQETYKYKSAALLWDTLTEIYYTYSTSFTLFLLIFILIMMFLFTFERYQCEHYRLYPFKSRNLL